MVYDEEMSLNKDVLSHKDEWKLCETIAIFWRSGSKSDIDGDVEFNREKYC